MSSSRAPAAPPSHPDARIVSVDTPFSRFLRVDVVRFRHKLFSGEWSGERSYDVLRRGDAVAIILYDPERDSVVLVEQFRLPALYAGLSPWQIEPVAGLVDKDESYEAVARRESREEAGIESIGELVPIQRYMPSPGDSDEAVMLFCGRVNSRGAAGVHGLPEEHEDIRVIVKTMAELEAMLEAGQIETGHTLICCYWLLRHRDRLGREWLGTSSV
ncbi:MAG: NUDIX domain-containing protein [Alphaproteobacteria bacterium]|nr:NUDIX domain-containing protein [Alphaproteobacteria bacterium]